MDGWKEGKGRRTLGAIVGLKYGVAMSGVRTHIHDQG